MAFYIYFVKTFLDTGGRDGNDFQKDLDKAAELINDLQKTQHERLSLKPPPHLGSIPGPGDAEKQLGKITIIRLSLSTVSYIKKK